MAACIAPPPLEDRVLFRHLDGAADRATDEHLEACTFCRGRVDELARMEAKLRASLFRVACPPAQELGEYRLGRLPQGRKGAVRRHLEACPHCAGELLQLDGFLQSISPEATAPALRRLVAQLLSGPLFPPALAPAAAGLRGEPGAPYVYQAEQTRIVLDLQRDVSRGPGRLLVGLITGVPAHGWTVELGAADDPKARAVVDEAGNFVMPIPPTGPFPLRLRGSGIEIQLEVPDPRPGM